MIRQAILAPLAMLAIFGWHAADAVPRYDHIVTVIEENQSFNDIIGNAALPYINSLADGGALFTDSHHDFGISQPNYLVLFSGSDQGAANDTILANTPLNTPNLGAQLFQNGMSFGSYDEGQPSIGYLGTSYAAGFYDRKHNPASNWVAADPTGNQLPAGADQPFSAFPTDAAGFAALPTVSFVSPDECDNMHGAKGCPTGSSYTTADNWLNANLGAYASWAQANNSLLILTWDEDDGHSQGHIATIMYGADITPGRYAEAIDHSNVLSTMESLEGLPLIDANAPAVTDVVAVQSVPEPSALAAFGISLALLGLQRGARHKARAA